MNIKNWWNNRSYWLKGGILSVGVALLLFAFVAIVRESFSCSGMSGYGVDECYAKTNLIVHPVSSFLLFFDFLSLAFCKGVCKGFGGIISLVTLWPSYFIIGAFLGWIYGKVRTKEVSQTTGTTGRFKLLKVLVVVFLLAIGAFMVYDYYFPDGVGMDNGYNIRYGKVYFKQSAGFDDCTICVYGPKEVKGIDVVSFQTLGGYTLDKNGVYEFSRGEVIQKKIINIQDYLIQGADPTTFTPINGEEGAAGNGFYSKDKNHVYFGRSIVEGADLETFKPIVRGAVWADATDKNHYYASGKISGDINPLKK